MTHWHVHRNAVSPNAGDSSFTNDFDRVRDLIAKTDPVVYRRITINEPPFCDGDHVDYWIDLDAKEGETDEQETSDSDDSGE